MKVLKILLCQTSLLRGTRVWDWICHGWISRFGAPDAQSRGPEILIWKGFRASGRKIGAPPKNAKSNHDRSNPPFSALWLTSTEVMLCYVIDFSFGYMYMYVCMYIYIYAVESKLGPKIAFFESKLGPSFLCFFFFVFQTSSSFRRENEMLKKNEQKKRQKNTFVESKLSPICCATYLDQVLTQPWTKFWLNMFANFWVFLPVWEDAETTIVIVLSAKKFNF